MPEPVDDHFMAAAKARAQPKSARAATDPYPVGRAMSRWPVIGLLVTSR